MLYGFGVVPDAVDRIDHRLAPSQPVTEGAAVAVMPFEVLGKLSDTDGRALITYLEGPKPER